MKPTKIEFEQQYSDDSGVEFAVRLDSNAYAASSGGEIGVVTFERINTVEFPVQELDWLIACLERFKQELSDDAE